MTRDEGQRVALAFLDRLGASIPPEEDDALLAWLAEREAEHHDEVNAAWREVLGGLMDGG